MSIENENGRIDIFVKNYLQEVTEKKKLPDGFGEAVR